MSETESGDYSAAVVLLIRKEVFFILEVVRGRFPFDTLKRKVMDLKRRYHPSTLLIEESPISLGLIQSLREQSINIRTYKPDTDKRARLIAQTDLFAGGSVRLPQRAGWLEEFVAELLAFPGGHDDQVDALTQGLAWGRRQWSRKVIVGTVRGLLLVWLPKHSIPDPDDPNFWGGLPHLSRKERASLACLTWAWDTRRNRDREFLA